MLQRQSERLTEALIKIDAWLRPSPQADQEVVGRRIGRHLGKYPGAAVIVVAEVIRDADGRAGGVRISSRLEAGQKAHRQKGAYLLRTNCEETDPEVAPENWTEGIVKPKPEKRSKSCLRKTDGNSVQNSKLKLGWRHLKV